MFRLRDWYVSNYQAMYKIYIVVFYTFLDFYEVISGLDVIMKQGLFSNLFNSQKTATYSLTHSPAKLLIC